MVVMPIESESKALARASALQRIRTLTHILDNAIPIPGTTHRIGLDPIIGLVPGGGDTVGTLLSAYIVLEALRFNLPKETLVRMVSNLALDGVLGTMPLLGDLFDLGWKANSQNLALLEEHAAHPDDSRAADRGFVIFIAVVVVAMALLITLLIATLISLLVRAITG